jgi:hypothetical protein
LQINFRGLDAGVSQALLQNVDRTAAFQPVYRENVAQIMETERAEILCLISCLFGNGRDDAPEVRCDREIWLRLGVALVQLAGQRPVPE